jgi:serine/threonine protein kinase
MEDIHKRNTLPEAPEPKATLPLPSKIGPYKIESLLNKGGMSLLYLGLDPDSGKHLAIKVLLPKFLKNKEIKERFLNEARIISMTQHPNIVKFYDVGLWEKGVYIAMEFIRGVSLRQFIAKQSFSLKKALDIILQVASALSHLHAHGVIHRDLKPENILISENGDIKVIDFGISQLIQEEDRLLGERRPRGLGTPFYMSPEQIGSPGKITTLADIYSIGIIAYELILGKSTHGVIHLTLLPKGLKEIIEKALELDPAKRYQDIVDFITDISHYSRRLSENAIKQGEEFSIEMKGLIDETHSVLVPQAPPRFSEVEIGLRVQDGILPSGLYLDFFSFSDSRLGVVLAEPQETGVASLFFASYLRGLLRALAETRDPSHILQALNLALSKDPQSKQFGLSFLLLEPLKQSLTYICCGLPPLWHIEDGSTKVRELSTPNPLLGADPNIPLASATDNWNPGDMVVLHSLKPMSQEGIVLEGAFLLPPQPLAEKLLKQFSHPKHTSAVVAIQRSF